MRAPADVLLVSAPFGPLYQPSLGLGLLEASAPDLRIDVAYLTLSFAELLGAELYAAIADGVPSPALLCGEWVFGDGIDDEGYLELLAREPRTPAGFVDALQRARRLAPAWIAVEAERVAARAPRIVGFSSTFQQQAASLRLARAIKDRDRTIVTLLGGANVEMPMGAAVLEHFPEIDVVVDGEGESAFADLCAHLLRGGGPGALPPLPGVVTRRGATPPGRVADMDALPHPAFDAFFEQWSRCAVARVATPRLVLETSRGCWWGQKQHCTFCGLNGASMAFRAKSSARAVEEILALSSRHGVKDVLMTDDILSPLHLREALPRLAEAKAELQLFYEVKANLTREQLIVMKEAGVTDIQPGIESLSDAVLVLMRKGVTALQNVQLLKWCAELGIHPWWNLLWGFPGEPPGAYERMAAWIPLLTHLPPPDAAGPLRLDRFSPCYEEAEAMGFVKVQPHPAYGHVYGLPRAALHALAYYFVAEHADGRDVAAYTGTVGAAVARWQEVHDGSKLELVDRGDRIVIADYRPVAARPVTVLHDAERELYLACDAVRSLEELERRGAERGWGDVEATIASLVDRGLVLRDGPRIVALALHPTR